MIVKHRDFMISTCDYQVSFGKLENASKEENNTGFEFRLNIKIMQEKNMFILNISSSTSFL